MAMVSKRTLLKCARVAGALRLPRQAETHRADIRAARPSRAPDIERYVLRFPKGLGGLSVNVFRVAPECNKWAPSDSNSAVKKGFQGSEVLDLGLGAALGRLGASVAAKPNS